MGGSGGGGRGPPPLFLAHYVGFLTLGPKFDPLLVLPSFACRPKMTLPPFSKIMDPPLAPNILSVPPPIRPK